MHHDDAVRQAIEVVKATDESTVVAAWLGSLSSRDLPPGRRSAATSCSGTFLSTLTPRRDPAGRAGTSPTEDDHDRLKRLLNAVRALPATARPTNLPHYTDEFVHSDVADNTYPAGAPKSDWAYPARCWTGVDGVNEALVTRYFGSSLGG